jgi:quinol monooxygenase YgiN
VLIVHATIDVEPENRDAVIAASIAHAQACQAEEGNHRYDISADVADPGRFYVTEEWEDDDALAAHGKQPHQRTFGKALVAAGLKGSTATKYSVGESQKLF